MQRPADLTLSSIQQFKMYTRTSRKILRVTMRKLTLDLFTRTSDRQPRKQSCANVLTSNSIYSPYKSVNKSLIEGVLSEKQTNRN